MMVMMQRNHPARLDKFAQCGLAEAEPEAENSDHEPKAVITGWVREHEHRSEEYRRAFKDMLLEEGFISIPTIPHEEDEEK